MGEVLGEKIMYLEKNDQILPEQKIDIKELIYLTESLIKVIEEENKIIQEKHVLFYQEIVAKKLSLIQNIENISLKIKEHPELLSSATISKKTKLKALYQRLAVLKDENSLHLRASIYTNKKISEIIKKILINRVKMESGYCNNGSYNSSIKLGNKMPAISYNTTT